MKRAMIVAHPDDETLFGAGIVIRNPGDWTIYCCTIPAADPIRAVKFHDACRVLGATGVVYPHTEPCINSTITWLNEIDLSAYDHIVTHNSFGEYGHLQHKDVNRYVVRTYGKKLITTFGFTDQHGAGEHTIALTDIEKARKMKALKCYDHVHPFRNAAIPKWEALYKYHIEEKGVDFGIETYRGAMP